MQKKFNANKRSGYGKPKTDNENSSAQATLKLQAEHTPITAGPNVKLRGCRAFRQSLLNAGLGAVTLQRSTKPNTRKKAVNDKLPLRQITEKFYINKTVRLRQTKTVNENSIFRLRQKCT
jgi:hypothetical protein